MILNSLNAASIAAKFGNKFPIVVYCGCWTSDTITFAMYQDERQTAGFELTLIRSHDNAKEYKVKSVNRLSTYYRFSDGVYRREVLPIFRTVQPINKNELYK
jgi:hypothetical protein